MAKWYGLMLQRDWRRADMADEVNVTYRGAVAHVEIAHPPANAMSAVVLDGLRDTVSSLTDRSEIRAVVFSGKGSVAFLSGADLSEMPALLADRDLLTARTREVGELYELIETLPQITIAAVGASAMGGGLEFILVCDLAVASHEARFGLPEVTIGLIPGAGGTQRLVRRIPAQRAREMLFLGSPVGAAEALALGLINQTCDAAEVEERALELAGRISQLPAVAVQSIKRAVAAGMSLPETEGLKVEQREFIRTTQSHDALEGAAAFLEGRRPTFSHH